MQAWTVVPSGIEEQSRNSPSVNELMMLKNGAAEKKSFGKWC